MGAPRDKRDTWLDPELQEDEPLSFDVTCTIGSVTMSNDRNAEPAAIAGFRLIYEYDTDGVFYFSVPNGDNAISYRIEVER